MDRHVVTLLAMTTRRWRFALAIGVCHCEPGWAGAAIQLKFQMDGLVAALLAMTNRATLAHILNLPHFPCGP